MSGREPLDSKYEGETRNYTFDFTSDLSTGVSISSAVVTAEVYSGEDATPSAIVDGSASSSGAVVTQSLTGGEEGVVYNVTCEIETSDGQTLQKSGLLAIVPEEP